jgi:hypothetical protein
MQVCADEATTARGFSAGIQQRTNRVCTVAGSPKQASFHTKRSFDRTEFDDDSAPSNVARLAPIQSGSRVLFRGVLSVHALAHLSEKGVQYLNHDFKERATNSALNGVYSARKHASMDLESIFASNAKQKDILGAKKSKIRVLIQGYMHSTASFMRCESIVIFLSTVSLY